MKILPNNTNQNISNNPSFQKKLVLKPATIRNTLIGMTFLGLFATDCFMRCSDKRDFDEKVNSLTEIKKETMPSKVQQDALVNFVISKSELFDPKNPKKDKITYDIDYIPNFKPQSFSDYDDAHLKVSIVIHNKKHCLKINEFCKNKFISKGKLFEIINEENGDFSIIYKDIKNKREETRHYFANGKIKE